MCYEEDDADDDGAGRLMAACTAISWRKFPPDASSDTRAHDV